MLTTFPPSSPDSGTFVFSDIRLGSRGDSYYEYLGKMYLQMNRTQPIYKEMHDEAMGGIKKHLLKKSVRKGLVYTSELQPRRVSGGGYDLADIPKVGQTSFSFLASPFF